MEFTEIAPRELKENIFNTLTKDWMLLTVEGEGVVNTMTVGWGGIGVMWGKDVVFVVVRPERYTHKLLETAETFSLSAFDGSYKKQLGYCGSVSGRVENKIEKCGFTLQRCGATPYIAESRLTFVCRKLTATDFAPEHFLGNTEITDKWYGGGYHTLYVAEIETLLSR